jgi:hypothetical protein
MSIGAVAEPYDAEALAALTDAKVLGLYTATAFSEFVIPRLLATIAARDAMVERARKYAEEQVWRAGEAEAACIAKDEEIARLRKLVDDYRGDVSSLNCRVGELQAGDVYLNRAFVAEARVAQLEAALGKIRHHEDCLCEQCAPHYKWAGQ